MANVRDVAQYILNSTGKITTWKLQKLIYYAQAWHLVWEEEPLFDEEIHAWANGPACPNLYRYHKGNFHIQKIRGSDSDALNSDERESVDAVLDHYSELTGQQLSALTHQEPPWFKARKGLSSSERGESVITHESMSEYYESL